MPYSGLYKPYSGVNFYKSFLCPASGFLGLLSFELDAEACWDTLADEPLKYGFILLFFLVWLSNRFPVGFNYESSSIYAFSSSIMSWTF